MAVFGAWGEEVMRSYYSVSTVFQGNKMKNIPEMDDGTSSRSVDQCLRLMQDEGSSLMIQSVSGTVRPKLRYLILD